MHSLHSLATKWAWSGHAAGGRQVLVARPLCVVGPLAIGNHGRPFQSVMKGHIISYHVVDLQWQNSLIVGTELA